MIGIHALKVDNWELNLSLEIMEFVSPKKREKYSRFTNKTNYLSVLGDLLVKMVIMKNFKLSNSMIEFEYNRFGKPFLRNINLFFNTSHSGDFVVCAFDKQAVGIDIELIRNLNVNYLKKYLTHSEKFSLQSLAYKDKINYFYELWTAKESYVKALGRGIFMFPYFSIRIDGEEIYLENDSSNIFFKEFFIDEHYKSCICTLENIFTGNVTYHTEQDVLEFFEGVCIL